MYLLFFLGAPGGFEQGGSDDIGVRATKAPAGLWLARGGQPPGMSNKREDAERYTSVYLLFFLGAPGGFEQGGSDDIGVRATKAPVGLWLARGGQPLGMSNKREDADRYTFVYLLFFLGAPGGFEQGGSDDIGVRATKAPAGLWLARGGQPLGMSNKREDADRYTFVYLLFFLGAPGGFEQGGSDDIGVRATKAPAGLWLARGGQPLGLSNKREVTASTKSQGIRPGFCIIPLFLQNILW